MNRPDMIGEGLMDAILRVLIRRYPKMLADGRAIWCWRCMEREVPDPMDLCRVCRHVHARRIDRANVTRSKPISERSHRRYRAAWDDRLGELDRMAYRDWQRRSDTA